MKALLSILLIAALGGAAYYFQSGLKEQTAANFALVDQVKGLKSENEKLSADLERVTAALASVEQAVAANPAAVPASEPVAEVAQVATVAAAAATPDTSAADAARAAQAARDAAARAARERADAAAKAEAEARAKRSAEAAAQIDQLTELRGKWMAARREAENKDFGFREQRVDRDGNRSGVRTSDAERAKAYAAQAEEIARCEAQLQVIDAKIAELRGI